MRFESWLTAKSAKLAAKDAKKKMTDKRVFNFYSGPAVLPLAVLEQAQDEMLSLGGVGMSVMEISHRSDKFGEILDSARQGICDLLKVPENYQILFLQGGATFQFSMVPINFLPQNGSADYVVTGYWGRKAAAEAKKCGNVNKVYNSEDAGFSSISNQGDLRFDPTASYIHYVSNETIDGVEFKYDLDGGNVPVVCDASSNILSKPIDISKYAIIYAGAQKNIGPSGVTLVIIRDDMLERVPKDQFLPLDYRNHAASASMANTPNTWGIYIIDLVAKWLKQQGGVAAMQQLNEEKAAMLYGTIDSSDGFYQSNAERDARSTMNVTLHLPSEELNTRFAAEAERFDLYGLKGHRSVGGIRASIYNAFPKEGVDALVEFMNDFAEQNR